jgi:hypothetical protein
MNFLQGNASGDIGKTFTAIKDTLKLYLDFSDSGVYDFLSCWVIGTYVSPIFSHYPYVHFTGPKANAADTVWQELRDQLFLLTMTEGLGLKAIYDGIEKPAEIYFSGRDWDIFKGVLAVAKAVDEDIYAAVVKFAVETHESEIAKDQENSPDMIILHYLSEVVSCAGWYDLGSLHKGLTIKATSEGLDLQGVMTKERFGKRLAALKVYQKRKRTNRNGEKIMEYWMEPNSINSKLQNHIKG